MVRTTRAGLALAAGAVSVLAGVAACGGETKIDHAKAEKIVNDHLDPKAQTVACPKGVASKPGVTFECQLTYPDGTRGTITVHVRDTKGTIEATAADLHLQP